MWIFLDTNEGENCLQRTRSYETHNGGGENCMQRTRSCATHNGGGGGTPSEKERKKLHAAATTREPASIIVFDIVLVSILHGWAEGKKVTAPLNVGRDRTGCLLLVGRLAGNTTGLLGLRNLE